MIDFRQIVVFRRQPKDRNRVDAAPRQLRRVTRRGDRLVQAVRGSSKKPHLLAGNDGHGAICQPRQVRGRLLLDRATGRESAILFAQDFDHSPSHSGIELHVPRRRQYAFDIRWMREIFRYVLEIVEKRGK